VKRCTTIVLFWAFMAQLSGAMAEPGAVTVAFVGDIMLADGPGKVVRRGEDPFAPFAPILDTADIRVGNLECVIATTGSPEPGKPWTFRAHPRTLPLLKRHFDALGLANNHSGDYGIAAFGEMLGLLKKHAIPYFGGGIDLREAHTPLIIERKGLRIALLAYDEFFPRSFEAGSDRPGVAWSEDEQVRLDIDNARRNYGADVVIPFMHWGWEFHPKANARQQALAHLMIEAGADAVVGAHPHVVQNIEIYRGRPIVYSLGNFVFDGFDDAAANTGWLLQLDLDRNGASALRIHVARIDKRGVPYPKAAGPDRCWRRGEENPAACRP
jgi:poly-gamma-glutamate capsule biosynthesis protein CapA/YwtB (metallophosphatase superfamily)